MNSDAVWQYLIHSIWTIQAIYPSALDIDELTYDKLVGKDVALANFLHS